MYTQLLVMGIPMSVNVRFRFYMDIKYIQAYKQTYNIYKESPIHTQTENIQQPILGDMHIVICINTYT